MKSTNDFQEVVHRSINQVVKIVRPDGGTGTGVYLPGDRIITCLHVVDGSPGVYITFRTNEQIEADVMAVDHRLDLALLMLRSTPATLTPEQLDGIALHPEPVELGEELVAIGHPLGLDWSVTGGHYNALRNPGEEPLPHFGISLGAPLVQVDVVINSGNSGGPILDIGGHLIGIADSIINPAVANNIGFAIAGEVALTFWQAHRDDLFPLIAYSCGHHHDSGQVYCPMIGKPVMVVERIPMPTSESVLYSCGHVHPRDLEYCPMTGKPVEELAEPNGSVAKSTGIDARLVSCTNCGSDYLIMLEECPQCGKPQGR